MWFDTISKKSPKWIHRFLAKFLADGEPKTITQMIDAMTENPNKYTSSTRPYSHVPTRMRLANILSGDDRYKSVGTLRTYNAKIRRYHKVQLWTLTNRQIKDVTPKRDDKDV
jgi:hypothetical protein